MQMRSMIERRIAADLEVTRFAEKNIHTTWSENWAMYTLKNQMSTTSRGFPRIERQKRTPDTIGHVIPTKKPTCHARSVPLRTLMLCLINVQSSLTLQRPRCILYHAFIDRKCKFINRANM